jgi:hypothetical protein
LVDEHAEGYAVGVETVQKVLDVTADEGVKAKLLLVLYNPLGHGRDHVIMTITDLNQQLQETERERAREREREREKTTYFF